MYRVLLNKVESALDNYAVQLPSDSMTLQSIIREDTWGEIANFARNEGYVTLASLLEYAECLTFA